MSASRFPPLQSKPSDKHCSNCSAKMLAYTLPGHYNAIVEIDVCMDCNAIWFDQFESMTLSPDGTVALFQLINERGGTATSAATKFSEGLRCVTCGDSMKLTQDQVKGTRFAYQACRHGHGRFTTFYNFLSEKQFVRELTQAERAKLAATVKQVRCSGCGAAINIGAVDACEYCRAPVSVFDRDAAQKAVDHYLRERQRQPAVGHDRRAGGRVTSEHWSAYDRADLGADILYALGRAVTRGVSSGMGRSVPAAAAGGAMSPVFADTGSAALPDATTALFGADALSGVANSGTLSSLASGAGENLGGALPSATDALFGHAGGVGEAAGGLGGEMAQALGDAASSGIADTAAEAGAGIAGGAFEALGDGAVDVAGDVASAAGEGIVDLVTDGIGSLLGALFS